jgi:biopolymer transport protein ExbD
MTGRVSTQSLEDEELNLTPLLDCIFNLVFFFLVATNLKQEQAQLEVQLPQAPIQTAQAPPESIVITIGASGEIVLNGETVARDQIETALTAATLARPGMPVEVLSDADAPMQSFVDVATALSRLHITFADLRTRPEEGAP